MTKILGVDSMSEAQVKKKNWYRGFKFSWESVESEPFSRKSSLTRTSENVDCMRASIKKKIGQLCSGIRKPPQTVRKVSSHFEYHTSLLCRDFWTNRASTSYIRPSTLQMWLPRVLSLSKFKNPIERDQERNYDFRLWTKLRRTQRSRRWWNIADCFKKKKKRSDAV